MMRSKNTIIAVSWSMLILSALFVHFRPSPKNIQIKKQFIYLPYEIAGFKGEEKISSDFVLAALGADDLLTRGYVGGNGEKLELYMSYFGYTGENKGPHAPQLCWVGAGWAFKDLGDEKIALATKRPVTAVLKKILAQKDTDKVLLLYCYKLNRKYCSGLSSFRALSVLDSILKRKNSAFTMQISSELDKDSLAQKEKVMKDFAAKVLAILEDDFLP